MVSVQPTAIQIGRPLTMVGTFIEIEPTPSAERFTEIA
jgi:hypothetical protein